MSSRGLATASCLLVVTLAGLLTLSRPAFAVPQSTGWLYDAIDRLKTLGVMPLWAGTVRPIPSTHLRAAVEEALKRAEQRPLSGADRVRSLPPGAPYGRRDLPVRVAPWILAR